jgi:ankyrin repeat protein
MKKIILLSMIILVCAIPVILLINRQNTNSILLKAVQSGDLAQVRSSITNGAQANAHNKQKITSLHYAAAFGHEEIAKFLIEQKADINASDEDGETPLILAARHGYLGIVKLLVTHGANLEAADQYGATALIDATLKGHLDIMKYLVDQGANIHAQAAGIGNQSALDIAEQSENEKAIAILTGTQP